jgi:flagellar basal-body rod protein FlgB
MLNQMFANSTAPLLEHVVNFTEARHGVLAGNIANLDTPGYKTRDLSPQLFQEQLKDALEAQRSSPGQTSLGQTSIEQLSATGSRGKYEQLAKVDDSLTGMLRHDDNNASLEQQVTQISKNQAQHNLAINLMAQQFRLLRTAINERVG